MVAVPVVAMAGTVVAMGVAADGGEVFHPAVSAVDHLEVSADEYPFYFPRLSC